MELSIRPATIDDYNRVALVFDEIDQLHRQALPHIFRAPDGPALDRTYFDSVLADGEATWLVAEHDSEILGFTTVRILHARDRPTLAPRRFAEVDMLAVRADHRRAGIGGALMQRVADWAAVRGLREIQLNVWEFNRGAIAFYEQLGYVAERRTMRRVISNVNS